MDFTAGHLARLHAKAGQEVLFLHLTAGEGGHPGKDRAVYKAQKLAEAAAAAGRLGAECKVLDHPDGDLFATDDLAKEVAAIVDERRPQTIVTHWRGSLHRDHANCYFAVERALELQRGGSPELWFADNWEDADGFQADLVVDISDVFDDWLAAARCHELFRGGVVSFDYQGYYEALTSLRGKMSRTPRAAAFMRPPNVFFSPVGKLAGD